MNNYNQQLGRGELASASDKHTLRSRMSPRTSHSDPHCLQHSTKGTFVLRHAKAKSSTEAERCHPKSDTATHSTTSLALNGEKKMELATEMTCRPVGATGSPAWRTSAGKASLEMRRRHYRNFHSNFPKGNSQKFT